VKIPLFPLFYLSFPIAKYFFAFMKSIKKGGTRMIRSFCGEYKCSADAKGRLMLPSKLRELFPEGESMILVRSLDRCINLYTEEKWRFFEEKIQSLPETESRDVRRFFYASMQDVEPDAQGRILLSVPLREFANITKSVVVLGCGDHAEIWNEEDYYSYISESRTASIEEILKRNGL
jgi:MraZ protein